MHCLTMMEYSGSRNACSPFSQMLLMLPERASSTKWRKFKLKGKYET